VNRGKESDRHVEDHNIIIISFSRSLFRLTIHMAGINLIILIVFAIIIGILIMAPVLPEGSLVSVEVGSRSEG